MSNEEFANPLRCYCGKSTNIYDGLFERNFCSDECAANLRIFLGGINKVIAIQQKVVEAGDFRISGSTVTLNETLKAHQTRKASVIDKIDAQIQAELGKEDKLDKQRRELKKIGLSDAVIENMLKVRG